MPGSLDSCINSVYEPGNIPASVGTPPTRVLFRDPIEAEVSEAAAADSVQYIAVSGAVVEAAAADAVQDWVGVAGAAIQAMLPGSFVNSDGTSRQAFVGKVMVNL